MHRTGDLRKSPRTDAEQATPAHEGAMHASHG
jgi:hypothetical protein